LNAQFDNFAMKIPCHFPFGGVTLSPQKAVKIMLLGGTCCREVSKEQHVVMTELKSFENCCCDFQWMTELMNNQLLEL